MRLVKHPVLCNYYVTYRCNAKCSFCDIWEKPSPYITLADVEQNLRDLEWRVYLIAGDDALVVGHTGFKGPWLCQALVRRGAEVMGYSLPAPTDPSLSS